MDGEWGAAGPHGQRRATGRPGAAAGGLDGGRPLHGPVLLPQRLAVPLGLPVQVGVAEGVGVCDGGRRSHRVLGQNVHGAAGRVGDGVDHAGRHGRHGHHAGVATGQGGVDGGDRLPPGGRGGGL